MWPYGTGTYIGRIAFSIYLYPNIHRVPAEGVGGGISRQAGPWGNDVTKVRGGTDFGLEMTPGLVAQFGISSWTIEITHWLYIMSLSQSTQKLRVPAAVICFLVRSDNSGLTAIYEYTLVL